MASDLTIIIPAAGLGRRMRSYGPKALIELSKGETVLSRQLNFLQAAMPSADVVVVVGYEAEKMVRHIPQDVIIVENESYETTNVARSISLALRANPCERALIVYGDLVFNKNTAYALSVELLYGSFVVVDSGNQMREFEVGVAVSGGRATNFSYGLPTKWAQVAYLEGKAFTTFKKLCCHKDRKKHFGYEVLNELLEHGGSLRAVEPAGMKVAEIDSSKDIDTARLVR